LCAAIHEPLQFEATQRRVEGWQNGRSKYKRSYEGLTLAGGWRKAEGWGPWLALITGRTATGHPVLPEEVNSVNIRNGEVENLHAASHISAVSGKNNTLHLK